MKKIAIIPARMHSTRLPEKLIKPLANKTIIEHVYLKVKQSGLFDHVLVGTDHHMIRQLIEKHDGLVFMTDPDLPSGTDRCYQTLCQFGQSADFVVNIQGDEPLIDKQQLLDLCQNLNSQTTLATLAFPLAANSPAIFDPNTVKVVFSNQNKALYFSRNPLPFVRNYPENLWGETHVFYKHIGLYAYQAETLKKITQLQTSSLEKAESLEQLRWLENGFDLFVFKTNIESIGVDTLEDYLTIQKLFDNQQ